MHWNIFWLLSFHYKNCNEVELISLCSQYACCLGGMLSTDLIIPESHPHTSVKCIHVFLVKTTDGTGPWSRRVIVFKAVQEQSFIWFCCCILHFSFPCHFWISHYYQQCWHFSICALYCKQRYQFVFVVFFSMSSDAFFTTEVFKSSMRKALVCSMSVL